MDKLLRILQGRLQQDGRPPGLHMYDSAADQGQPAQRSSSGNGQLVSPMPNQCLICCLVCPDLPTL